MLGREKSDSRVGITELDKEMLEILALGDKIVLRDELRGWLKKDKDESFKACSNKDFLSYLDGFIIYKRGKKDKAVPVTSQVLTNNLVLKKLKISLSLKSDDIMSLLELVGVKISKRSNSPLCKNALCASSKRSLHFLLAHLEQTM